MKKIEAIIRPSQFENLRTALYEFNIHGMTVSQVHGVGKQKGKKEVYRGTEVFVNLLPKIKLEIITHDECVEAVIELICEKARTGEYGDGKIFVYNIDDVVRIRTRERGHAGV